MEALRRGIDMATDWMKTPRGDGIIFEMQFPKGLLKDAFTSEFFRPIIDITIITSIIHDGIELAHTGKYKDAIEKIENGIFKYFGYIAKACNKTLNDESELPEIIDYLKQEGFINPDVWSKLLDLLLIIDGLKLQEEILAEDIKLLSEICEELEKIEISMTDDSHYSLHTEIARIGIISSGTLREEETYSEMLGTLH